MKSNFIISFFIFILPQLGWGSADILYKGVKPEFIKKAYARFDEFYFKTCPKYRFKPNSVEHLWVKAQQDKYQSLGHPLAQDKTFIAPQYTWLALEKSVQCYSLIIPRLNKSKDLELLSLLKKYHFKVKTETVNAVEFLLQNQQINLYTIEKKGEPLTKVYFLNNKQTSTPTTFNTTSAEIKKAVLATANPDYLKKIGPLMLSVLSVKNATDPNHSIFFLANMFPGFLRPSGDRLVQDVLRNFHFKPRAISPIKDKDFVVYYP